MIFSKTNPVAEDAWVHRLLISLEAQLLPLWTSAVTDDCLFYGRSEIVNEKDVFFYDGSFRDVYMDRDKFFISFVRCADEMTYSNGLRNKVSKLVCQGNLKKLYPSITHRADAELRKDCEFILMKSLEPLNYSGHTIISGTKTKDMQPFHTFELNFNMVF